MRKIKVSLITITIITIITIIIVWCSALMKSPFDFLCIDTENHPDSLAAKYLITQSEHSDGVWSVIYNSKADNYVFATVKKDIFGYRANVSFYWSKSTVSPENKTPVLSCYSSVKQDRFFPDSDLSPYSVCSVLIDDEIEKAYFNKKEMEIIEFEDTRLAYLIVTDEKAPETMNYIFEDIAGNVIYSENG